MCAGGRTGASRPDAHNYAGALTPQTSAYGQAFRGAGLVRAPAPLAERVGETYRNSLGVVVVPGYSPAALVMRATYGGDLPLAEQREVEKPFPWLDARRGAP